MRLHFDQEKASQAAAHLLRLHKNAMPMISLVKLLYLCDRRSLLETGLTITGDRLVNMHNGPVLSRIYELIVEADPQIDPWCAYLKVRGNTISLAKQNPKNGLLSDYEAELISEIHGQFGQLSPSALIELVHGLPEWEDPGEGRSTPIEPAEILRLSGASAEEVREATAIAEEVKVLRALGQYRG